ncbi:MAG: SRPBCC family protein [Chitinophagaceae bacterium]|nr:SRPBCC family protein [Chitinophagaceae bacterium]
MIVVYIIVGLILFLLVMAMMLPGRYHIEKTTIIHRSVREVMDKIADLNHYAKWNPWQQSDPSAVGTITGTPHTAGHKYAWKGRKVGEGSLTLRDLDSKHVHFNLEFVKPFKSKASDDWLLEEWGSGDTKVTWSNNGEFPFPVGRLLGPAITKGLHKQFVEGLASLKKLVEA